LHNPLINLPLNGIIDSGVLATRTNFINFYPLSI
jgi:hypothetical protein